MAVPSRKISKRMRGHRRSHHALQQPPLSECNNCGALIAPHRVCSQCGHFKGKEIIEAQNY